MLFHSLKNFALLSLCVQTTAALATEPSATQNVDAATTQTQPDEKSTDISENIPEKPFHFTFATFPNSEIPKETHRFALNLFGGVGYNLRGVELGGANWRTNDVKGVQFGLLYNVAAHSLSGAQVSFVNYAGKGEGVQVAFVNTAGESFKGAQVGFVNVARDFAGFQGGFVNVAGGTQGAQLGFVNVTTTLSGAQLGFVNVSTQKSSAAQIGFVNVASEGNDGVSLGFFNFVKGGIANVDVYAEQSKGQTFGHASFRSGARYLYSLWDVGYSLRSNVDRWEVSYGLGGQYKPSDVFAINLDISKVTAGQGALFRQAFNDPEREKGIKNRLFIDFRPLPAIGVIAGGSVQFRGKGYRKATMDVLGKQQEYSEFDWGRTKFHTHATAFVGLSASLW